MASAASFVNKEIYLKNHTHNAHLGTDGKTVYVTPNKDKWEQFHVQDAGAGKVYLHSSAHKQNLGVKPDGSLYVTPNKDKWEQFHFVAGKVAGTFALKSFHNSHIGTDSKKAYTTPNLDLWESWHVSHPEPPYVFGVKYYIKNVGLGKYFCMDNSAEKKLLLSGNSSLWEQFVLSDGGAGKVVITSATHAGQNICGQPDKYSSTPNKDLWEKHALVATGKGSFFIVNHHNTVLGGKQDNTVAPTPNKAAWEEWQFIKA